MGEVCWGVYGSRGSSWGCLLWWKSIETPKGVQLETVMGTLLVGSKGVDVPLNV